MPEGHYGFPIAFWWVAKVPALCTARAAVIDKLPIRYALLSLRQKSPAQRKVGGAKTLLGLPMLGGNILAINIV
jgi:hypothetical protein